MKEQLQKEIQELKHSIHNEQDADIKIGLTRKLYKKKLELIDIIHQVEKSRAGLSARQLIAKVSAMKTPPKFSTGISKVDASLGGGFETGLFINLAGESGAGKTTFLLNVLANMSQSKKVVFFNFEMGDRLFVKKLKDLKLNEAQLDNLTIDSENFKVDDLIMEIELYAEEGIKFFAIDSKMKLSGGAGKEQYQQISNISSQLAKLAARKDIVIFLINQISEEDIKNGRLSFKGSGDQKYDTDIALFLTIEDNQRKLICTKNRMNDKTFDVDFDLSDFNSNFEPIITVFETQTEPDMPHEMFG
jgi:predicted ATP-dependent serine protease